MKRQLPSQLLEERFLGLATRRALLSDSILLGAQLMLQKAVELEVAEFLSLSTVACAHPGTAPTFRAAVGRNAAFMRQGSGLTPDCRINAAFRGQCLDVPLLLSIC